MPSVAERLKALEELEPYRENHLKSCHCVICRLLESGFPMPPEVRAVCEEMRNGPGGGDSVVQDWLKRIEEAYE